MVEEFLEGEEASFFALVVGGTCIPLGSAQVLSKLLLAQMPACYACLPMSACACAAALSCTPSTRRPCGDYHAAAVHNQGPGQSQAAGTATQPHLMYRTHRHLQECSCCTAPTGSSSDLASSLSPGSPLSVCLCDQDHKAVGEGDTGPNTGGMGAYSPAPCVTPAVEAQVMSEIVQRTADAMVAEGAPFTGILFAGLMIKDGQARAPACIHCACACG